MLKDELIPKKFPALTCDPGELGTIGKCKTQRNEAWKNALTSKTQKRNTLENETLHIRVNSLEIDIFMQTQN